MIQIEVRPYYRNKVNNDLFRHWAEKVLVHEGKTGDATIVVTGNKEIQALNQSYRHIDAPTDVLSFCDGTVDPDSGDTYLGDILISWMKANQQAQTEGHSLESELALLTVHGMLHLLGFDHQTAADRKRMWHKQAALLAELGLDMSMFSELEKIN
jgi:probable rRNA maturation factor